ncbi:unnamed protein product [Prunus armeniaca]
MGHVRMPDKPTTRGTSSSYHNNPPYAGTTTNATYGVCQHAGYSYDTCDLNTITYHPSYVGTHPATYGVCHHAGYSYDMCDLNTISHITPHTSRRTRPRMGSVNKPSTPTTRATST